MLNHGRRACVQSEHCNNHQNTNGGKNLYRGCECECRHVQVNMVCVCVCVCVCVSQGKKSARRMASMTSDTGDTTSK